MEEYNIVMTPAEAVTLALVNSPTSCTIAGNTWGVTTFCEAIEERYEQVITRIISVGIPWHSASHLAGAVEDAEAQLRGCVDFPADEQQHLTRHPAMLGMPVIGPDGRDLRTLPPGTDLLREVLVAQTLLPGNFPASVAAAARADGLVVQGDAQRLARSLAPAFIERAREGGAGAGDGRLLRHGGAGEGKGGGAEHQRAAV